MASNWLSEYFWQASLMLLCSLMTCPPFVIGPPHHSVRRSYHPLHLAWSASSSGVGSGSTAFFCRLALCFEAAGATSICCCTDVSPTACELSTSGVDK